MLLSSSSTRAAALAAASAAAAVASARAALDAEPLNTRAESALLQAESLRLLAAVQVGRGVRLAGINPYLAFEALEQSRDAEAPQTETRIREQAAGIRSLRFK